MTTSTPDTPARGPADHDVRAQIVKAATEHFSLYGYEKTAVSDLAKAIGFSKAYIYKFFESKQAIGEMICATCLHQIESEVRAAVAAAPYPPQKLRRLFEAVTESTLKLFSEDRKLYEIAASATTERWKSVRSYEASMQTLVTDILREGRQNGDFERKTPLDEAAFAVCLILRPIMNPVMLQYNLDCIEAAPGLLSGLVLRSLSP